MKSMAVILAAAGLALAAPAPKEGAADNDLKKLQGTWKLESARRGGEAPPADVVKNLRVVFSGTKLTVKDGGRTEEVAFKLVPGTKPKGIDLLPPGGNADKPALGIYRLEGGTLKLCWTKGGGERPKEFASPAKSDVVLMVLKREKK